MTWRIPAWYFGRFSRTPYRLLNETRTAERIVAYSIALPPIVFLAYLIAIPREELTAGVDWLRSQPKYIIWTVQLLVVSFAYAPIFGSTTVRTLMVRRRIRRLVGRCLSCSDLLPTDNPRACFRCGSDLVEQANFRVALAVSTPYWGYAGLRTQPPEKRRFRRIMIGISMLLPVAFGVIAYWNYLLEQSGMPRFPMGLPQWLLMVSLVLAVTPILLWAAWSTSNFKRNLERLRDRCLNCEASWVSDCVQCANCGDSIFRQQLYVWKRVITSWQSTGTRAHAKEVCALLGTSPPVPTHTTQAMIGSAKAS